MELNLNNNPSMNNIYDSKYYDFVKNDEQQKSNDLYNKVKSPFESGYMPRPAYSTIVNGDNNTNKIQSLTGNTINVENFTHSGMQPYFGAKLTQNTNIDNSTTKLEYYTGVSDNSFKKKKEIERFFVPTANNAYINGTTDNSDFLKDRVVESKIQNNTFLIESVKVAPGLNQGYNSKGYGGFQQENTNEFAIPRSLDELRSKINEKSSTFEIPFQGPSKSIDKRADVKPFSKNRPDKVYEQCSDNWFKTTGAILKEQDRPEENLKPTARINTHTEYIGNLNKKDKLNNDDDYGKTSIIVYNNERQLTETKTVVSNLTNVIKAMAAPILDILKLSNKEYLVESARLGGNARTQIPEKATLYDPVNHVMRTTIKETNIHNNTSGNLTGNDETYTALYDEAKTTIKETNIHDATTGNLTGNDETYTALYDGAKTTIKETNIHNTTAGNLTGNDETYTALYDDAKTTMKETSIHDTSIGNIKCVETGHTTPDDVLKKTLRQTLESEDNVRNIGGINYKIYKYDPKIIAKRTVKQTTIKNANELGFLGGILEGLFGGYLNANYHNKNTQKQFTSDYENYGIAGSKEKFNQTDRTAEYNAEIDGTREKILMDAGYTPGAGGKYIGVPKENINMEVNKQTDMEMANRAYNNVGKIYQSTPVPITTENTTKNISMPNAYCERLDSSLLNSLKTNDYNIAINPIRTECEVI